MNRRKAGALIAGATSFGLCSPLLAKQADKKLKENENLKLEDRPLRFRLRGRAVKIDWLLLYNGDEVLAADARQAVHHVNENRVSVSKIPILGGLTNRPLSTRVFANSRQIASVHQAGKIIAAFPDAMLENLPSRPTAAVPIPYPNTKTSLRPRQSFRKVKVSNVPAAATMKAAPEIGVLHLIDDVLVFGIPGIGL